MVDFAKDKEPATVFPIEPNDGTDRNLTLDEQKVDVVAVFEVLMQKTGNSMPDGPEEYVKFLTGLNEADFARMLDCLAAIAVATMAMKMAALTAAIQRLEAGKPDGMAHFAANARDDIKASAERVEAIKGVIKEAKTGGSGGSNTTLH